MGIAASSNHVLKVIALTALLVGALITVRACHRPRPPAGDMGGSRLPDVVARSDLGAEADTEAETLRTLIGEVRRLRDESAALKSDNAALREQNARFERMEERLGSHLQDELRGPQTQLQQQTQRVERQSQETESLLQTLEGRLAELAAPTTTSPVKGSDIPVGLGFEGSFSSEQIVWIDPLDVPPAKGSGDRALPNRIENLFNKVGDEPARGEKPAKEPVYTVPRNATLVGARGFTALVGRIPARGQVVDPFPFKVLVGENNLAANGVVMPELFGMVFSGRAVGDWTLSCVRGELFSVTYVFQDGSIQSYPIGDADTEDTRPIGWISDAYGVPCVKGERKSNAESFLRQRIGLSAAAAAAKAAAAAETTTTVSGTVGATTTAVTGDVGSFIGDRALSGGLEEISRWLGERQAQSFDAVYVPPDSELVVHVTREIAIDLDPKGRKVNHVELQAPAQRALD
jgi:integrating conjugative element protein (TIGR03752 family)